MYFSFAFPDMASYPSNHKGSLSFDSSVDLNTKIEMHILFNISISACERVCLHHKKKPFPLLYSGCTGI